MRGRLVGFRCFVALAVLLAVAAAGSAAEVRLQPRVQGQDPGETLGVEVRLESAGRVEAATEIPEPSSLELKAGEERTVELRDGLVWTIRARAEGHWSPEVFVTAGETVEPTAGPSE
jgi:hypothetical protein